MEQITKLQIASEVLIYLQENPKSGLFTPNRKKWIIVGSTEKTVQEITLDQLLVLSTFELLELQKKIENAKRIKEITTRQQRYFLK